MQIQRVPLSVSLDPLCIKPMLWTSRVARKPQLCTVNGAAGQRLFHERARHQHNFVQQHTRQRPALDQCIACLVLSAEHFKVIRHGSAPHFHYLVAAPPADDIALLCKAHRRKRHDDILGTAIHRAATHTEALTAEILHRPAHKRPHHDGGLAGTHSAIADKRVVFGIRKGHDFLLLF